MGDGRGLLATSPQAFSANELICHPPLLLRSWRGGCSARVRLVRVVVPRCQGLGNPLSPWAMSKVSSLGMGWDRGVETVPKGKISLGVFSRQHCQVALLGALRMLPAGPRERREGRSQRVSHCCFQADREVSRRL